MPDAPSLNVKVKVDWSDLETAGAKALAAGTAIKAGLSGSSGDIDKVESSISKLGASLSTNFAKIGASFSDLGAATRKVVDDFGQLAPVQAVVGGVERAFTSLTHSVSSEFAQMAEGVTGGIREMGQDFSNWVTKFAPVRAALSGLSSLGTTVFRALSQEWGVWTRAWALSVADLQKDLAPVGRLFGSVFGAIGPIIGDATRLVGQFGSTIGTVFSGVGGIIKDFAGEAVSNLGKFGSKLGEIVTKLPEVGQAIMSGLVAALIVMGAVASPAIALLGEFTVGLGATLSVMSFGGGVFTALAAGMVLLADKTGNLEGPMQSLKDNFSAVANTLGQQAAPAAAQILSVVEDLLGPMGSLASQTITWVESNGRLSNALDIVDGFANTLFEDLQDNLGPAIGGLLDEWLARGPEWQSTFAGALQFVDGAIIGLLENLLRLSDWFQETLPTVGPEVQAVFDGLGQGIQDIGHGINDFLGPTMAAFQGHASDLANVIRFLIDVIGLAVDAILAMVAAVAWVIRGIDELVGLVERLTGHNQQVAQSHQQAATAAQQHGNAIQNLLQGIDGLNLGLDKEQQKMQDVLQAQEALLGDSNSLAQAQDNLNQQVKSGTETHDQLQASLLQVAAAQEKQTEDTQTAAGITVDAKQKAYDYADSLDYAAAQAAKIGDSIDAAEFTARAEEIRGEAASIGAAIAALPSTKIIHVVTESDYSIGSPTGHQHGGPVVPNRVYLVGEAGPELFVSSTPGNIIPNNNLQTQAVLNGTQASPAQDPRPTTMIQLLSDQNQLLRAWVQAMMTQPQPVGRWPYAGRTT